jgi:hypothetical protein
MIDAFGTVAGRLRSLACLRQGPRGAGGLHLVKLGLNYRFGPACLSDKSGTVAVATGQRSVAAQRVGFVQFLLHGRKSLQRARAHAPLRPCLDDRAPAEPGIRNDRDRHSLLETAVVFHLLNDDPG